MKFITKISLLALILSIAACDGTELELLDNPNAVTPERASVNDLYNAIQLNFNNFYSTMQRTDGPGGVARMYGFLGNFTYPGSLSPNTLRGLWLSAYSGMYPDVDALTALADERGLDILSGSAKVMKAYTMMGLVDVFGDVPYSEIGQGTDIIAPVADPGKSVYDAANALLDEAIAQLEGNTGAAPTADNIYGGDAAKWIKAANTLKLRLAITTRLVDPSGAASIINGLSEDDLITSAADDFQWNYGSQRTNPNNRHPFYNLHYEIQDGDYLNNYYMWLLRVDKVTDDETIIIDPRIRFYFRRKVEKADEQDQTTYSCHFSALPDQSAQPAHYAAVDPRLPYCIVLPGDGYSGRDHLNGEGIPPDGPIRTSYGLYPGGGSFDANQFDDTRKTGTSGGLGAGIDPIMMSSFTDFMLAEAALTLGTNGDARALLESGIRKSIDKVFSFKSLVPGEMSTVIEGRPCGGSTVEECFVPDQEAIDTYVDFVLSQYDDVEGEKEGQLAIVAKEYYIALWGNGLEAYNLWRRTGYPDNMQPAIEPDAGTFARSFFYPNDYILRNKNATQRSISDPVFWDDGSADVY
ncbi:MAG: SusD/RagB family nutrient-binding outer membrane lipoprotein [Bacteroidota bacterium]